MTGILAPDWFLKSVDLSVNNISQSECVSDPIHLFVPLLLFWLVFRRLRVIFLIITVADVIVASECCEGIISGWLDVLLWHAFLIGQVRYKALMKLTECLFKYAFLFTLFHILELRLSPDFADSHFRT